MTEATPSPKPTGGGLSRRATITVTAAVVALVVTAAALIVGFMKPWQQNTVDNYIEKSGIANKSTLRVGVFRDAPGSGERIAGRNGNRLSDFKGFDIEVVRALARYLGYVEEAVVPVITDPHERSRQLAENNVEIVVANYSMTQQREDDVDFAGPYLISKLSVLVRAKAASGPETSYGFADLKALGKAVCTTKSSTSETELRREGLTSFTALGTHRECAEGVRSGQFTAFVLDEVILAGYYAQHEDELALAELVTERFEKYGIAVANGDEHLRQVVGNFLLDSYERGDDGAWQRAWNRTLGQVSFLRDKSQPRPENVLRLRDYQDRYQSLPPPLRTAPRDTLLACPVSLPRPRS